MRLNIPAGTAARFEPGDENEVELVEIGGSKTVVGFNNLVGGSMLGDAVARQSLERAWQK
jgi:urease beta subunit